MGTRRGLHPAGRLLPHPAGADALQSRPGSPASAPPTHRRGPGAHRPATKRFALPITGTCGFDQAQVTAGGLRTEEFDPETLESRVVPGLVRCGEVLDVDGDCGGFNLQWAWSSGNLAGLLL